MTGLPVRGWNALAASLCCAALSGCSLLGLDDDLEQSTCSDADFCASLNDLAPTGDPCLAWTCGPQNVCEVLPLDEDGDGSPAPGCAPSGVTEDCADDDARRAPTLSETCDTIDNDCDTDVDEEAMFPLAVVESLLSLDSTITPAHASYLPLTGGAVAVAYQQRLTSPAAETRVDVLQVGSVSPGSSPLDVLPATLPSPNAFTNTLTAVGSTIRGAIGFAGCTRVVPGTLSVESATRGEFTVVESTFSEGLPVPDGGGNVCMSGDRPDPAMATPVSWLASAAETNTVLYAWLEVRETLTETCTVPLAAPVRASSARVVGSAFNPASAVAITLGTSTAPERPAAVPIDGEGWLVAFPTTAGYEVHVVRVTDAGTGALESTELVSVTQADVRQVTLAKGGTAGTVQDFLLGVRSGCTTSAAVAFRTFGFDTSDDSLVGGTASEEFAFTRASSQENPLAAFQASPLGWLVAWTEAGRLTGARVDATGTQISPPQALTMGNESLVEPYVFPLVSGDGFGVMAYNPTASAIQGAELDCSLPTS